MTRALLVRAAMLYGPLTLAALAWWWQRDEACADARRRTAALIVACGWNAVGLVPLQLLAARAGWWDFAGATGFWGMPAEAYVGWILLWGVAATLAAERLPLHIVILVALWLDLLLMPRLDPVLVLGESWLVGEAVAIVFVLVPSQLLARWTLASTHLTGRVALQAVTFSALTALVIPVAIFDHVGGSWAPLFERAPIWNHALAQLIAVPAVFGLSAVQEFALRGHGTPLPYDPPLRLVTSGPYAYLANPMQMAMVFVFAGWALILESPWMLAAAAMAFVYSVGLAAWHEDREIADRYGDTWTRYRGTIRKWRPRFRPAIAEPSRVYIATSCELCSGVSLWLTQQNLVGLDLCAAEDHPTRHLTRLTYEAPDGYVAEGVEAFARCLEHINLIYAWLGMLMRLPVVRPMLQLMVDATGGGPRRVCRASKPNDDADQAGVVVIQGPLR